MLCDTCPLDNKNEQFNYITPQILIKKFNLCLEIDIFVKTILK
jgi:hypothetical protein